MRLAWIMNSPGMPGLPHVERHTSAADFMDAMEDLAEQEEGYVEVRSSESDYPLLAIGFRHARAVLHRFLDAKGNSGRYA